MVFYIGSRATNSDDEDKTMGWVEPLTRETRFLAKDRALLFWMIIILFLSSFSVISGIIEVTRQEQTLALLLSADTQDRNVVLAKQKSWGSAAYYSFHFVYNPPSSLAFAALGMREKLPWKHRLNMLAIEGQIYENDTGNPTLSLIGRFDFSFLTVFILPLLLMILLHDIHAKERMRARHQLLEATDCHLFSLWHMRAILLSFAVALCLLIPFVLAALLNAVPIIILLKVVFFIFIYTFFWAFICIRVSRWEKPPSVLLSVLVAIWVFFAVLIPSSSRLFLDRIAKVPSGGEIILAQREAVNDAWDLPKSVTMAPFIEQHKQFEEYAAVKKTFEWKWYYAFQHVADQTVSHLSTKRRKAIARKDQLAGLFALASPPALLERQFLRLAKTDIKNFLEYEKKVRDFHARLSSFYYPKLFQEQDFNQAALRKIPVYAP